MPRSQLQNRTVYIYLKSEKEMEDWKTKAKKNHVTLSKFIHEHATNSLRQEAGEERYEPRAKMIEHLRKKDEEIQKLTRENEIVKLALERVEAELRRYRAAPFLDDGFQGVRKYDRKLIDLLKKGEAIDSDHLLHLLRISPKESDLVKAVSNQLENLEAYGLVRKTHHGWRWVSE
ncbi:MAG: hypothetical protein ABSF82_13115 [Candidatus Bathyarchaeia archaeon]|jgi:hypothetical protein